MVIDYYLTQRVNGPISITITDALNRVVREYTNVAPPRDTLMPNVPAYWLLQPTVLSTTLGMHRISWDLRYPTPPSLPFGYTGTLLDYTEFTLNWHSIPGQTPSLQPVGPLVVPGLYFVTLKVARGTMTRRAVVVADPRVGVPQAALAAQLQLMQRMVAGLASSNEGFTHLQQLHAALAARLAGTDEITVVARSLDSMAVALSTGPRGFGPSNRDLARRLTDMEYGDVNPTQSVIDAAETNCRDIEAALTAVRALTSGAMTRLNALLTRAQLGLLPAWNVPAGAACGIRSGN